MNDIKYIAAYQTAPISAVTHYAEVDSIEPYGDGGKYKLNFVPVKRNLQSSGSLGTKAPSLKHDVEFHAWAPSMPLLPMEFRLYSRTESVSVPTT